MAQTKALSSCPSDAEAKQEVAPGATRKITPIKQFDSEEATIPSDPGGSEEMVIVGEA